MAISQPLKERRPNLFHRLESIIRFDSKGLCDATTQPGASLAQGEVNYRRFFEGLRLAVVRLHGIAYWPVSDDRLATIEDHAKLLAEKLEFFIANQPHLGDWMERHFKDLFERWDSFISSVAPIMNVVDPLTLEPSAQVVKTQLAHLKAELQATCGKAEVRLRDAETEAKQIVDRAKAYARDAFVSKESARFLREAGQQFRQSCWAAGLLVFLFVCTGFYTSKLSDHLDGIKLPDSLPVLVPNALLVSMLFLGMSFCTRVFMASRHGWTVNRHRANALNSYKVILDASKDRAVSDAVLVQVSSTVFTPGVSGYIKNEPDSSEPTRIASLIASQVLKKGVDSSGPP